jgi:integration host factor subunit alpha
MTLTTVGRFDLLFENIGPNGREARDMVETFFEEICGPLERGEGVKPSRFGNF